MSINVLSVSQLNRYVKALLEEQKPLADIMLRGELSDTSYRPSSGQLYFTLCDDLASIRCVMFSQYTAGLKNIPEDGMAVIVRGKVTIYERAGQYQLIAYDLQETGKGTGSADMEQLRRRLASEGLFDPDRKRTLPRNPAAVGVIVSQSGAAIQDIIETMRRRNPLVKLVIYPALAQGDSAPAAIAGAIASMSEEGLCQSAIVARGGGSSEDLSAFNAETVVRAAAASAVPIVSAVGHETDFTLLDMVADARAATPTAACYLVTNDIGTVRDAVRSRTQAIFSAARTAILSRNVRADSITRLLHAKSPASILNIYRQRHGYLVKLMLGTAEQRLWRASAQAQSLTENLTLLDPQALFSKGYSATFRQDKPLRSIRDVRTGDVIITDLADGRVVSAVTEVLPGIGG